LNYKKTLYFISKCLTISSEDKNRYFIEKQLQSDTINWDAFVKVSTSHYVFPALYCNFKRTNFLKYLPADLVQYMKYITNLNKDRNIQIISQVKELNRLLLANNITPMFLKGTGNLLAGIYEDIAERMMGDIDFIVSIEDYPKVIKLVREFGYSEVNKRKYYIPDPKHYRRLQKENNIAAIEIHTEILNSKKYRKEFNYSFVKNDSQVIDEVRVLSYANKLNLSIISYQINDHGNNFKTMALRNAYDVFLLSKKTNAKAAINTLDKLSSPLNCFLATCDEVFNHLNSLEYNKNKTTASYLSFFDRQFTDEEKTRSRHKRIKIYLFLKGRLNVLFNSLLYKKYRVLLFKRLADKSWYKQKLQELGFKE
jgi:hypothetical protein